MNISVETLKGLERRMTVEVPSERVSKELSVQYKKLSKTAKLHGFRPGKVPLSVIEKRYGESVRQELMQKLVQQGYGKGLQEHKLQPAGMPNIDMDPLNAEKEFKFTATFEIYPEVKLPKLEGLKVEKPEVAIGEDDVNKVIERLRTQHAHWHEDEGKAETGHRVTIDFEGTLKGEKIDGGQGKNVPVILGEGRMLEAFEKKLKGLKTGAHKKFKVKMPKDYHDDALAGKAITYDVNVLKVEHAHLPELNDEFFKTLNIEGGEEALRKEVQENMTREMEATVEHKLREQLIKQLIAENPIDVPQIMIEQETDYRQESAAKRMQIEDKALWPKKSLFEEEARRAVNFALLLQKLIEQEKISTDKDRLTQKLQDVASQYSDPETVLKQYQQNPSLMRQLEQEVLEQQSLDWLQERATITPKKQAFSELMNLS